MGDQNSRRELGSDRDLDRERVRFEYCFCFSPRTMIIAQDVEQGTSNLPEEPEKDDYWKYIPLYQAALQGDWVTADAFFCQYQDALTVEINELSETTLHVAAGAARSLKSLNFIQKLVDKISTDALEHRDQTILTDALEHRDQFGRTALHLAAWVGNTKAVEVLLNKHISLLYIRDHNNNSAIDMAAENAKEDTLSYLLDRFYKLFPDQDSDAQFPFSKLFPDDDSTAQLLILVISSGYYGMALDLVKRYSYFSTSIKKDGSCGLKALARKDSAFKSSNNHKWWQCIIYALSRGNNAVDSPQVKCLKYKWTQLLVKCFYTLVSCIKNIQDQKKKHLEALELVKVLCARVRSLNDSDAYDAHAKDALLTASKFGIHEVIEEIVQSFPTLLWAKDKENLNVLQIAVIERHANVFNLIYQMGGFQEVLLRTKDGSGNNLLHLAGKLAPPNKINLVSGAALQMQRELQWFEEVKKFTNPGERECRNNGNETPKILFTKEHQELRAAGEKWMKGTANSCTIPAALIVTVVFAAAITVPGGLNSEDGIPIFSKKVAFNIFALVNALSLFAAITSLVVSLTILNSRYAEVDFLFVLPNRLIFSLVTLFLSITAMVVSFSLAVYIMFENKPKALILCPLVALALLPISSFAILQSPLLKDLIKSTYFPRNFGKKSERLFY